MRARNAQKDSPRTQRRRAELVAAAKQAFLTRPYSEVTVEEIALAAGLSKATVYLYFSSKVEIWGSIIERDVSILREGLEEAYDPGLAILDNLQRLARSYVAFFRAHPEYFRSHSTFFLPGRGDRLPAEIADRVNAQFSGAMAVLERALSRANEAGEIVVTDARISTVALWSIWLGANYLAAVDPGGRYSPVLDRVVETGVKAFVDGIAARRA